MPGSGVKIISGGQTGADRGALDAALALDMPCGGWCPEGRLDENGRIPGHYPLTELPGGGFRERTIKNVRESDGALILYLGEPQGGTQTTVNACIQYGKAYCLLDRSQLTPERSSEVAVCFVRENDIRILNVAGPRASEDAGMYAFAFEVIAGLIQRLTAAKSI